MSEAFKKRKAPSVLPRAARRKARTNGENGRSPPATCPGIAFWKASHRGFGLETPSDTSRKLYAPRSGCFASGTAHCSNLNKCFFKKFFSKHPRNGCRAHAVTHADNARTGALCCALRALKNERRTQRSARAPALVFAAILIAFDARPNDKFTHVATCVTIANRRTSATCVKSSYDVRHDVRQMSKSTYVATYVKMAL